MGVENLDILLSQSNPPLRQRRQRTNFNDEAIQSLEEAFARNPYPDINEREEMARDLKTTEDRIQVWFQNKRARYRKKMQKETVVLSKSKGVSKKKQSDVENLPETQDELLGLQEESRNEATPISHELNRTKSSHGSLCSDSNRLVSTPKIVNNYSQSDYITPSNQMYYSPCMPNDSGFVSSSNSSFVDLNRSYLNSLNLNAQIQMLAALNSPFYLYSSFQPTCSNTNPNNIPTQNASIANSSSSLVINNQSTPDINRVSKPFFKPYE